MANIESLKDQNKDSTYRNFSFLRSHNPEIPLENQVYAFRGKEEFLNMTNLQVSALVPHFKMFIRYGDKDFELPFQGTSLDPAEVLTFNRTRALGFRDFQWTYEGKYLETAKKQIEANLSLYGDNLGVFDKVVGIYQPNQEDVSKVLKYNGALPTLDLKGAGKVLAPREIKFADLLTRDRDLQFKVHCGWSVPHGTPEELISTNLKSAIESNIVTLVMELVEHTFEFEQDGTFGLNLRYKSRILGGLQEIDLMAPPEERKGPLTDQAKKNRKFETELRRKFSKELDFNPTSKNADKAPIFSSDVITEGQLESFAETHFPTKDKTVVVRELKDILRSGDTKNHRRRAQAIVAQQLANKNSRRTGSNLSRILNDIENRSRVFYLEINTLGFKNYFEGSRESQRMQEELNNIDGTLSEKEYKEEQKRIVLFYDEQERARRAQISKAAVNKSGKTATGIFNKITSEELNKRATSGPAGHASGTFKLPYFYFGDLIEAALNVAGEQYTREDVSLILGTMPHKKFAISTFEMKLIDFKAAMVEPKIIQIPLVDVPISTRNYSAWIHNEYIKKPTTKIELSSFIIGAFNNLIKPAFSGETDLVKLLESQKSHLAVNSNTFSSEVPKNGKTLRKGEISLDDLNGIATSNSPKPNVATKNFVLFSANQVALPLEKPTPEEVRKGRGIVLTLGRDRGLVKTANFSKLSMPNLVAARFMVDSGKNERIDKIKEPYNVDLTMVGNNLFSQGIHFYLLPTVPGKEGQKIAKELGLGGYYATIGASMKIDMMSGFTTTLRGSLQNFGPPDDVKSAVNAEGKKAEQESLKRRKVKGAKRK